MLNFKVILLAMKKKKRNSNFQWS